jgi:hypothetical protein
VAGIGDRFASALLGTLFGLAFHPIKNRMEHALGVSALSRGARSDGDVVARKPAAAMTPDWQAATEFQARNPGNYFCCFAYSFPVSGIRFPKSRKNFLILNFYFLLSPVLLITDLFHPVRALAVQLFHNGDVRHRGRRRRAVPMLLPRAQTRPHRLAGFPQSGRPNAAPIRVRT